MVPALLPIKRTRKKLSNHLNIMYTQCPKCLTYFQVTAEHLKVAQGNVRCGQCSNVFSALGNLSEFPPQGSGSDNGTAGKGRFQRNTAKMPNVTKSNAQSKLTTAIAAIQALNQSSQHILSQGRKNYVTQLQRQAQAKRKYPAVDNRTSTARDLNREDPADDKLADLANEELKNASQSINFDEALAAIDEIEIELNEQQAIEDDEPPIQYGTDGEEDITPAYDGSHLVEDYNTQLEEPTSVTTTPPGTTPPTAKVQPKARRNDEDDFDFSNLELPDTEDSDVTKKSTSKKSRQLKPPAKKTQPRQAPRQKIQQRKPVKKKAARTQKKVAKPAPQPMQEEMVIENNIPTLAIPKQLLEDFQQEPHVSSVHYRSMITWGVGSLLLMLLFLGQTIYFKHNELGQISQLRPWIQFFCKQASCELSMQEDITQIELLGQDIRTHPKTKKALLVSATIINNAPFTQPYPGLRLSFSDMNGEKVAARNFLPKDYLPSGHKLDDGMESNVPIHLELEIVDPGKSAVNFEFDFFPI